MDKGLRFCVLVGTILKPFEDKDLRIRCGCPGKKDRRLIDEWLTRGKPARPDRADQSVESAPTINEMVLAFWNRYARTHDPRQDDPPSGELDNFRCALRPLRPVEERQGEIAAGEGREAEPVGAPSAGMVDGAQPRPRR
jgi:hypothetical protein